MTGGAGRLGSQISDGLAEAGAHVVVASRNLEHCIVPEAEMQEVVGKINKMGRQALAWKADVSNRAEIRVIVAMDKMYL